MHRVVVFWAVKADPLILNFSDAATAEVAFRQLRAFAGESMIWASSETMINCKHILHANLA